MEGCIVIQAKVTAEPYKSFLHREYLRAYW